MTPSAPAAPAEAAQIQAVRRIFTKVAPVYDLANRVLSLREDVRWRRFVARALRLSPGAAVLDVAAGTGDLTLAVARRPERPLVVGLDLVPAMLGPARAKLARAPRTAPLLCGDGTRLPFPDRTFQAVTIAFGIRNIPRRGEALGEMRRVLQPGGRLYVLEFATPPGRLIRALYLPYLRGVLPRLGGFLAGDPAGYRYLADTILAFPSPPEFRGELLAAGLAAPRSLPLTHGVAWLHVAERPAPAL